MKERILSLCDFSGVWSEPYREAGYEVIQVDLDHGQDVRLLEHPGDVVGILAAPPYTHLAGSGARWWAGKGESALLESLAIADACLRFAALCSPRWWVLENPVGRLSRYYGPPAFTFHPCDYGDPYTKRTCLWGRFTPPPIGDRAVKPTEGSKMHLMSPGPRRARLRSETPRGFAKAFFASNP
jgi:hypothetical protein